MYLQVNRITTNTYNILYYTQRQVVLHNIQDDSPSMLTLIFLFNDEFIQLLNFRILSVYT